MRFKKNQILEVDTSSTTSAKSSVDTNNNDQSKTKVDIPDEATINRAKKAVGSLSGEVDKLNKNIEDNPISAFITKENEDYGTGEDFGDIGSSDIEVGADDYDEYQKLLGDIDSLSENLNKRKVLKTIKVKDIKK